MLKGFRIPTHHKSQCSLLGSLRQAAHRRIQNRNTLSGSPGGNFPTVPGAESTHDDQDGPFSHPGEHAVRPGNNLLRLAGIAHHSYDNIRGGADIRWRSNFSYPQFQKFINRHATFVDATRYGPLMIE